MDLLRSLIILIARICICSLYLWAGWAKLLDWQGTVAYMKSKNFPMIPLMLPAAIFIQIVGGLSLLLGFYSRLGALALIAFTIPAMIKMHNFWRVEGTMRSLEKTFFMKDIAIIGALLALFAFGPGNFSVDGWLTLNERI